MDRKKPALVQDFADGPQQQCCVRVPQVQLTRCNQDRSNDRRACPTLDLVNGLYASFPSICRGMVEDVYIEQDGTTKLNIYQGSNMLITRPPSTIMDPSRGSRPRSTPPNNMDSKVESQSSMHGSPSSGASNLNMFSLFVG